MNTWQPEEPSITTQQIQPQPQPQPIKQALPNLSATLELIEALPERQEN